MTISPTFKVVKRNSKVETINLEKVHKMVEHACEGLTGVSESQIEMNANIQWYDGIKTTDIQEILIRSANDLISLENPNYQFVAARLLLFALRKSVYGCHPDDRPPLLDHLEGGVELDIYDPEFPSAYTDEEWEEIDSVDKIVLHILANKYKTTYQSISVRMKLI